MSLSSLPVSASSQGKAPGFYFHSGSPRPSFSAQDRGFWSSRCGLPPSVLTSHVSWAHTPPGPCAQGWSCNDNKVHPSPQGGDPRETEGLSRMAPTLALVRGGEPLTKHGGRPGLRAASPSARAFLEYSTSSPATLGGECYYGPILKMRKQRLTEVK